MEEVWGNISLPCLHNFTSTAKPPILDGNTNFYDVLNNEHPYTDQHNFSKANSFSNTNQNDQFVQNPSSSSQAKRRPPNTEDEGANDRRRLRSIKNRESADRSRARKQAYTNELKQEIENLKEENASLRDQLEKAKSEKMGIMEAAATSIETPAATPELKSSKRNSLRRTLTAPF